MRLRSGSAESVVFPVPDKPNKMALSPLSSTLAEQCMVSCLASGSTKFITVNMVFFTTPQ